LNRDPADMTPLPQPSQAAAPAIQTRRQLDAVLENIAHLQRERDELYQAQEKEIADVRQKYRASFAEMEHYLDLETGWAESWARGNPGAFTANRSLACAHATIGFRATPPRIERASRRWTWSRIAQTLAGLAWGARYLRVPPPEVDKEALLADLADLSPVELRDAGIKIVQGERFFITPHPQAETAAVAEPAWQEAA
jgi:phage host-nuclease inhibitor protein Gam